MRSAQGKPDEAESGCHGDRDHAAREGSSISLAGCRWSRHAQLPALTSAPAKRVASCSQGAGMSPAGMTRRRTTWRLSGQPMVLMVWRLELLPRRRVALPAGEPLPRPGSSRSSWFESWGSWGGAFIQMSPLFPAGDHAVRHAHGGGVADGIDGCHRERFGSPGRRVDETAVCDRPGTRRHPSATIAAGIARADLRIQTVCRTRHRRRDRDRRRLLVHLVPGDRSSRTAVTHDVTDLAAVRGGAGRLRPGRHTGGEVKARVRRVRETRFEITCGACNRDIAVVPRAVRRGA